LLPNCIVRSDTKYIDMASASRDRGGSALELSSHSLPVTLPITIVECFMVHLVIQPNPENIDPA
jgi:hypothetical protein